MDRQYPHIPDLDGKKIAVLGLGRTGEAATRALTKSGAEVFAWDDSAKARNQLLSSLSLPEHRVHLVDLTEIDWQSISFLVLSPGIAHTFPKPHPAIVQAKAHRVPILSDIELLYRSCPDARYIGITGTNGKSTVTSLIGHILNQAGRKVEIGGNLGQAALGLEALSADGIYVLELSSYQLDITPSALSDIAILLNITPDHIDRHGDLAGYISAKTKILGAKNQHSIGIIGLDDPICRDIFEKSQNNPRKIIGISGEGAIKSGIGVENGILTNNLDHMCIDIRAIATLPGRHNGQNAAAAFAACRMIGLSPIEIERGLRSYPGLAHRQELVAQIGSIFYVNDSKATNADAAIRALACYEDIYWLIGGRPKESGLAGTEPFYPRIKKAYIIGEAEDAFARHLEGQLPFVKCGTLDRAFDEAHHDAQAAGHGVVLLSPACASFDQYPHFEARGDHFRNLALQALQQHQVKRYQA